MKAFLIVLIAALLKDGESVSFDQCGVSVNCLTEPSGCTSFESCNAVAQYYYNGVTGRLEIHLISKAKWVAFGQVLNTAPNKMTNLYGAYCINRNIPTPNFGLFKSVRIGSVDYINASTIATITLLESGVNATYFKCSYSRPLDVGIYTDSLLPLNDTQYFGVLAYGSSLNEDELLEKHDNTITSQSVINWTLNPQPTIVIASSILPITSSSAVINYTSNNMSSSSSMFNSVFSTDILASLSASNNFHATSVLNSSTVATLAKANFSIASSIQLNSSASTTNSVLITNIPSGKNNDVSFGSICKASHLVTFAALVIIPFI